MCSVVVIRYHQNAYHVVTLHVDGFIFSLKVVDLDASCHYFQSEASVLL